VTLIIADVTSCPRRTDLLFSRFT